MNIFSLIYQNDYEHQNFQDSNMRRGAFTHKYSWNLIGVDLWCYVTNKIYIDNCRRCMDTKLGKVLT